ncbi:hypothetical protein AAE02nite_45980 [Adhaeribacter aerolatus]|uniref:DUF4296 domain-containing protein n=1 Tax=Adhaeribacter aerolatus TaxID=670289 RepID=A0A512B4M4_9BACT|nr:hypothetical protein [Adhaeribacter aerolatus]GEO06934.1 hypothetical protein AAE02nite_45980 [Adhaeribacter aerolatus]
MKKFLLSLLFILILAYSAEAQQISESAEKRVALITRVMAAELGLNESEYIRLKAFNRERIVKGDQISEFYANNPEMKTKKLLELEANFDKKFKTMLNPTQLAAYAAYKHDPTSDLALEEKAKTATNNQK